MDDALLLAAAVLCVVTASVHSYFGEKRLIAPVINSDHGVMVRPLAKQVMRFAWHWTSALWILVAAYLALSAQGEIFHRPLLFGIGFFHLAAGLLDGLLTRGKHIGWPLITLMGVLVLAACL
ncbi:hypothetical protein [Hyphococcus luteus]|uniref:Uncharacterized protein n=1 Tax=Hyphococcus luteus TaxID=2058213 RepID=A0A2S7K892_9PROT|nr:hypothetical protein [Marinicaulis flavus]PQA88720.1 hypothetical protein CW354_10645 [Marinicaulis flavus]